MIGAPRGGFRVFNVDREGGGVYYSGPGWRSLDIGGDACQAQFPFGPGEDGGDDAFRMWSLDPGVWYGW